MRQIFAALCGLGILAGASMASAAVYQRSIDWTGTSANPQGAWAYAAVQVGSGATWYDGTRAAMGYDTVVNSPGAFVNISTSGWTWIGWAQMAKASQNTLIGGYNYHATQIPNFLAPATLWTNTEGNDVNATVAGNLAFTWTRADGLNGLYQSTIQAALVKIDAGGSASLLSDLSQAKPSANWNVETKNVAFNQTYTIQTGEKIMLVAKGWTGDTSYLAQLNDSAISITTAAVPEPTMLFSLVGASGMMLLRRRSR